MELVEIRIANLFKFADGRTAIVGEVAGERPWIGACEAAVFVEGRSVGVVRIEGEMIPNNPGQPGLRVVTTLDPLPFDSALVGHVDLRLRLST